MVKIIQSFLEKIYAILPDSPFQAFFDSLDLDFVHWLNWFIPFDVCFKMTEVWVAAIAAYYLFSIVKKIVFDLIIGKLLA